VCECVCVCMCVCVCVYACVCVCWHKEEGEVGADQTFQKSAL